MKRFVMAAVLALIAPLISAEDKRAAKWEEQWDAAFGRARAEQKFVLVDFYASWCGPCRKMESETFRHPAVQERLSRFVVLKLNFDDVKRSKRFDVHVIPYYSIRDASGRQLAALIGYHDARLFVERLDAVIDAAPEISEVGEALKGEASPALLMRAGAVLARISNFAGARIMYGQAAQLAEQQHDSPLAQQARIESAVMSIRSGEVVPGLKELRALTPVDAEHEAAIWLAIGYGEQKRRRTGDARKAYQHALERAPESSAVRRQIEEKIAALEKRR